MANKSLPESGAEGPGRSDDEFMDALTGGAKSPEEFAKWARKEARRIAFMDGKYKFKAPAVCHAHWTVDDWMRYVDSYDGWLDYTLRDPP